MQVREPLRMLIVDGIPELDRRVFQPGAPDLSETTPKPFEVVRFTVLSTEGEWDAKSGRAQVWVHAPRGNLTALDDLADRTIAAVNHSLLTDEDGRKYVVEYAGSPLQEAEDLTYQSLARPLDFMAYRLDWLVPSGVRPDLIANGLGPWARATMPSVQTNPDTWDPKDATPGLFFRLERGRTLGNAFDEETGWVEVIARGHAIAPTPDGRANLCRRVASLLGRDREVLVEAGTPDECVLWVDEATFDTRVNPYTDGQLTIRGRMSGALVDDPLVVIPGPPMRRIHLGFDPSSDGAVDVEVTVNLP